MAHEHIVVDTDAHFRIDKATREISTLTGNAIIMQYDHNSERFTFDLPRMIDGHDMMQCNQVQVHYINIGATAEETNADVYDVVDLAVSEEDENKVILSWLISGNATKFAGVLNFLIKFNCVIDGVVEYAWNTAIYKGVTVSNGMNNGEAIAEEYSDLLADWEARIEALERGGVSGAVLSVNGNNPDKNGNVTIDFTEPVNEALAQAKASGVFDGKDGADGKTPVKGVDYWTDADQESIVQQVIAALGTPVFGTVDAENNIILSGALVDGTYTIKYEDADGNLTEIGTLVHIAEAEPSYTNQIPISVDTDGSIYNGKGYKEGTRISSSSGSISANDAVDLTGFIRVEMDDIVRMKNVDFKWATVASNGGLHFYAEDKVTKLCSVNSSNYNESTITSTLACQYDADGNLIQFAVKFIGTNTTPYAWMRVCASGITDESIITVNEEITD